MKLLYQIIVTDKNGKVIERRKRVAKSWLTAYNELLFGCFNSQNVTMMDINGVNRAVEGPGYYSLMCIGGAGYDYLGPVIGSGNTAVTMSDHALETQIEHGTGFGQMDHLATLKTSPTVDATSSYFTLTRQYINKSGNTISVEEIGIYGTGRSGVTSYYFCWARDVLGAPVSVPDGGAFTLIYTIMAVE